MVEQRETESSASSELNSEEAALLLEQLRRAVARACPHWQPLERDDVVQAAIVRVIELRRRNPDRTDLSYAYLRRVAYSAFIDEVRKRQRRGEVGLETDDEPVVVSREPGPERRSSARDIGRAIRDCLATVIKPRRRAVTLHLQGHNVPEIARLLGWDPKRAENLVYRGMADLRKCLVTKGVGE